MRIRIRNTAFNIRLRLHENLLNCSLVAGKAVDPDPHGSGSGSAWIGYPGGKMFK